MKPMQLNALRRNRKYHSWEYAPCGKVSMFLVLPSATFSSKNFLFPPLETRLRQREWPQLNGQEGMASTNICYHELFFSLSRDSGVLTVPGMIMALSSCLTNVCAARCIEVKFSHLYPILILDTSLIKICTGGSQNGWVLSLIHPISLPPHTIPCMSCLWRIGSHQTS